LQKIQGNATLWQSSALATQRKNAERARERNAQRNAAATELVPRMIAERVVLMAVNVSSRPNWVSHRSPAL
jgi:hypothetical protein